VVPASFYGYFTAAGAAAGVLIGLLFVAVSLRPDTIFGEQASPAGRAQARRAWSLVQGKHLSPASRDTPTAAGDPGQYGDAGS